MRVPKYAARTVLTAVKITSAGVSKPLHPLHDVTCLICCFIGCHMSHSMPRVYIRAPPAQPLCGSSLLSTCLKVVEAAVAGQHILVTLLQSALHAFLTAKLAIGHRASC